MKRVLRKISEWLEHWHRGPLGRLSRAAYWIRAHTIDRYHVLDVRCERNGYAWGWMDQSEKILFATMAVLVYFVEEEKAFDCHVDWRSAAEQKASREKHHPDGDAIHDAHAAAKKEMLEIYQWWTRNRRVAHDHRDAIRDRAYAQPFEFERAEDGMLRFKPPNFTEEEEELRAQSKQLGEALEAKDEEMMIRLIKVRGYMWT